MKPRLNIVSIGVSDLNRSRDFYKKALGWLPAKGSDDNIVFYDHGGIIFALYPLDKLAEDALVSPARTGFSGVTMAINLDSKKAVDDLYEQIVANSGQILVEPRNTFWGGYDCYFADPDGHTWEIAWAPSWEYDEKGSLILES